jgi:flagellar hook-associated protein 1
VQSAFAGLELGKRGVVAHQQGLQTVGHNVSNASAEGYSRQRIEMSAADPLYYPQLNRENTPGQVGQGVDVQRIERVKDQLLEGRIVSEDNIQGYWEARDKYLLMLEQVYNEPTDSSVRNLMDKFWDSWQELSLRPTEIAARKAVLQRGNALAEGIRNRYTRLQGIRDMLEGDIQGAVKQMADLVSGIAGLNGEIIKSQAMGDNPNDLMDRRDVLVGQLAQLADVTVSSRDPDEMVIATGGLRLVQGSRSEAPAILADPDNEGYSRVVWADTGQDARFRGGRLAALLELRDRDARGEIQDLDMMSVGFMDMVNEIHRGGFDLSGAGGRDFFVEYPFINNLSGNYDRNGDGAYDSTYVFRITGAHALAPKDQIGLRGALTLSAAEGDVSVEYYPTDTVEDLVSRINLSGSEVTARLNAEGRLSLKGSPSADPRNPDFVIRALADSGQFLVGYAGVLKGSGPDGAYTWRKADAVLGLREEGVAFSVAPLTHPSGWIVVNPKLAADPGAVAAASGTAGISSGIGDGAAALAIAQLRTRPVMLGQASGFDAFFAAQTADIGLRGEEAAKSLDTAKLVIKDLTDMRESISGVNIDEEMTKMITYQRGYAAIARFITTFDEMLDVIINRMGV